MFFFFPNNYMWSQAALRVQFTGGSIGEVARAISELAPAAERYDTEAWYAAWGKLGDQLWARGSTQEADGHTVSARGTFLRACAYYQWAVSFLDHADPRKHEGTRRSVDAFGRFGALSQPRIAYVEVPYEGSSFPAWFVPGQGGEARKPALFYLPGWDSTKEQGVGLALAAAERGISSLLCDGPGIGEAVLFRHLVNRYDYEVPGTAAFDELAGRGDVDPKRIAVVGASMGGYRAGRVAAFEHRLAGAVAWGAMWDFGTLWNRRKQIGTSALPTPPSHALHVMGAKTLEEIDDMMGDWKLEKVAKQIRCPLLVLHGEKDSQIAVEDAYTMYEESGSAMKELKIFTETETGAAHCQNDNRVLAHDYIGDWLVDVLARGRERRGIVVGEVGAPAVTP